MGENERRASAEEALEGSAGEPATGSAGAQATVPREQWLRTLADLDNLRRRSASQARDAAAQERRAVLTAFLAVLDSLERALAAHAGERNEWFDGTLGIFRQTAKLLQDFGVTPIEAQGRPFDPQMHEAVAVLDRPDLPDGAVVEVVRPGYRMADSALLRAAQVAVNRRMNDKR